MKSRKRALDSREKTLALEYKSMNKSNKVSVCVTILIFLMFISSWTNVWAKKIEL